MKLISNVFNKIKDSPFLKSGLAVAAGRGTVIVSNFLIFFILVRICTPEDFGTWILFTSITAIFEVANTSFVNNAIIKYYNEYTGPRRGVFIYNALLLCVFLIVLIGILQFASIFLLNGIYDSDELTKLMWYAPVLLLFSGLINFVNCIEQGNMRFYGQLVAALIRSGMFIFYLFWLYLGDSNYSLREFLFINILSGLVALIVTAASTWKYITVSLLFRADIIAKISKYGFFTFGVEVIGQVSNNIGQLISGALLSPAAVGIINVATRILQFIEVPMQSVSAVLMPKAVKTLKESGLTGVGKLYEKTSAFVIALMLPVCFLLFVFSDQVIYLIAGKNFGEASLLLKIIVVYSLFKPFGRNAGVVLNAIGHTKVNFFMVIIPTALNLLLNYFLIKEMGVVGSPIATFVATIVGLVISQYVLTKIINIKISNVLAEIRTYYQLIFQLLFKRS